MAEYKWPDADKRTWIGKRVSRIDGADKVSGRAKYTYDLNRPGMLFGTFVRCPYAHAKVVSIDTSAAEKMPGVKAIKVIQGPGSEIQWAGDEVVALAAVDEATAAQAVQAVNIQYEKLPHLVLDNDPVAAGDRAEATAQETEGDPDKAFREADAVVEGDYGLAVITHCCLEAHGQISEWTDKEHLLVHPSTQNVSGIASQMGTPLEMPPGNIKVHMDHVGGGFGSKFGPDRWGIVSAQLSQLAG